MGISLEREMPSLRQVITEFRDWMCSFFRRSAPPSAAKVIDEFFIYGGQYYLAGRYGMFAGLIPVAANLLHHGVEMLLKGELSKTMTPEQLKVELMHNLPKIWKRFKQQAKESSLDRFNKVIKELSKYNEIRYPDSQSGMSAMFDITRAGAAQSSVSGPLVAHVRKYKLCLEDIDDLVSEIFRVASRNPKAFLDMRFVKPEAREFLFRDNAFFGA
jgi:hypothetical protein